MIFQNCNQVFWCSLFASIGTTPPHFLWISICDKTTLDKISKDGFFSPPFASTIATLVSSHDVSMARIIILLSMGNLFCLQQRIRPTLYALLRRIFLPIRKDLFSRFLLATREFLVLFSLCMTKQSRFYRFLCKHDCLFQMIKSGN